MYDAFEPAAGHRRASRRARFVPIERGEVLAAALEFCELTPRQAARRLSRTFTPRRLPLPWCPPFLRDWHSSELYATARELRRGARLGPRSVPLAAVHVMALVDAARASQLGSGHTSYEVLLFGPSRLFDQCAAVDVARYGHLSPVHPGGRAVFVLSDLAVVAEALHPRTTAQWSRFAFLEQLGTDDAGAVNDYLDQLVASHGYRLTT